LIVLYALTDLDSSTELTASYLEPSELLLSRAARQTLLAENFGFACSCASCDRSQRKIVESDKRLAQYRNIKSTWESTSVEDYAFDKKRALIEIEQAMEILWQETRYREVESVLEQRFKVYAAWGQREEAMREGKKLTRHYRYVAGQKAARESDAAKWSERPELSVDWEACLKVDEVSSCWGELARRLMSSIIPAKMIQIMSAMIEVERRTTGRVRTRYMLERSARESSGRSRREVPRLSHGAAKEKQYAT
jgi:hypothetical protein